MTLTRPVLLRRLERNAEPWSLADIVVLDQVLVENQHPLCIERQSTARLAGEQDRLRRWQVSRRSPILIPYQPSQSLSQSTRYGPSILSRPASGWPGLIMTLYSNGRPVIAGTCRHADRTASNQASLTSRLSA